jgi:signal recognition particle receptor subunit beta
MAHIDFKERQVTLKLVYYGPPRSGKTTNLRYLHGHVDASGRGRLVTLDTREDRTLFFDLLPIFFRASGLSFRVKVYTVPGQPMHEATRRVVLRGADAVAFVADSRASEQTENRASYRNLLENLERVGLEIRHVPIVVQYNKRDLENAVPESELDRLGGHPLFPAVATAGPGVIETFLGMVERTWVALEDDLGIGTRFGIDAEQFLAAVRAHLEPRAV